jgi:hypothetical protein
MLSSPALRPVSRCAGAGIAQVRGMKIVANLTRGGIGRICLALVLLAVSVLLSLVTGSMARAEAVPIASEENR